MLMRLFTRRQCAGLLLAALLALVPAGVIAAAQQGYPCELEYTTRNGQRTHFHRHLRVIFHDENRQITLFDAANRQVYAVLEDNVDGFAFQLVDWSPDCRFIAGQLRRRGGNDLYVWESESGQRVQRIEHVMRMTFGYQTIHWSPDVTRAVFEGATDSGVLHLDTGALFRFESRPLDFGSFRRWVWDMPNQRFYAILRRGQIPDERRDTVIAVDLNNGQIIHTLTYASDTERIVFDDLFLSADRNYLVAFSVYNQYIPGTPCYAGFAVWHVWDASGQVIPTGCVPFPRAGVALSPDNRYFVAGRDIVRVWDLQAPGSDPARQFDDPQYRIGQLRFVDEQTIETFAPGQRRYALRWNLFSGEFINAYDYERNEAVNRDGTPIR